MSPSRASISRTRWPLPSPPMAGLQDIAPIVAKDSVTRAVRAPMRADAAAASQPAWPPPTTITSKTRCHDQSSCQLYFITILKTFHVKHFRPASWWRSPPATKRDESPYAFDEPERPGALQEAIGRAQRAGSGKRKDEPRASLLQSIGDQHGGHGEETEKVRCPCQWLAKMSAARQSAFFFRTFLKTFHVKHFGAPAHLPMQKREKISPKISSTSTTPVSLCSENIAARKSSASNSAGASGLAKTRSSADAAADRSFCGGVPARSSPHGRRSPRHRAKSSILLMSRHRYFRRFRR